MWTLLRQGDAIWETLSLGQLWVQFKRVIVATTKVVCDTTIPKWKEEQTRWWEIENWKSSLSGERKVKELSTFKVRGKLLRLKVKKVKGKHQRIKVKEMVLKAKKKTDGIWIENGRDCLYTVR